ncbi:MAG: hypothetical protein Q9M91_04690 [Candidatus Dojkabacteria bacterium]|nr:hypothetical protein [Candidatus Dojkabacteria bacterium]
MKGRIVCESDIFELEVKYNFAEKEAELFDEFKSTEGYLGEIHDFCGGWIKDYDWVMYGNDKKGKTWLVYNSNLGEVFVLDDSFGYKYWEINGCEKLGLPLSDTLTAEYTNYGKDTLIEEFIQEAYWQPFDNGQIYHYRSGKSIYSNSYSNWHTYAIWDKDILTNYSTLNGYGFPTSDSMSGLSACVDGIRYQRFEYKILTVLDTKRVWSLDDNPSKYTFKGARRNNNLVCGYLNSHKALRGIISDNDAYINIISYIAAQDQSNGDFIGDIYTVFTGKDNIIQEVVIDPVGPVPALYTGGTEVEYSTVRDFIDGNGILHAYKPFSDAGFKTYLRDSKYVNTLYSQSVYPDDPRSNQLYHATGGMAAGWYIKIDKYAIDSVEYHEIDQSGWVFGDAPKNGGSMEDLLLNYMTAFESIQMQNDDKNRYDVIDSYKNFRVDGDMLYYLNSLVKMEDKGLIDEDKKNKLSQFIIDND